MTFVIEKNVYILILYCNAVMYFYSDI